MTDEVRQIQALMILMMCMKPMGKLHALFEHVLRNPVGTQLSQAPPISDPSHDGLRTWLESVFAQSKLSVPDQAAIDWQKDSANMAEAIKELEDVETKLGIKLVVQKK
jgi:hypothetical protein